MFKKGRLPHNTKEDGRIVVRHNHRDRKERPYKFIRISKANWKMLHVHIWEKHYGAVPEGCIITFKDGDTMNCELDNLQCITRVQHIENIRNTDNYTAKLLSHSRGRGKIDREMQKAMLSNPTLLSLKRHQLTLNKAINETANKTA